MTLITAEISAAPHLPWGLRTDGDTNAEAGRYGADADTGETGVTDHENDLIIVSHAATVE